MTFLAENAQSFPKATIFSQLIRKESHSICFAIDHDYLFSSLSGITVRKELLFFRLPSLSDFTLAVPGLQEGERAKAGDDRRLGLDNRDSSEMIDMLSSSSSGWNWKTLARADVPWKQSISTCSCNVEAR